MILSVALQYGTTLSDLSHSCARLEDGSPASIVGAVIDCLADLDNLTPQQEYERDR